MRCILTENVLCLICLALLYAVMCCILDFFDFWPIISLYKLTFSSRSSTWLSHECSFPRRQSSCLCGGNCDYAPSGHHVCSDFPSRLQIWRVCFSLISTHVAWKGRKEKERAQQRTFVWSGICLNLLLHFVPVVTWHSATIASQHFSLFTLSSSNETKAFFDNILLLLE